MLLTAFVPAPPTPTTTILGANSCRCTCAHGFASTIGPVVPGWPSWPLRTMGWSIIPGAPRGSMPPPPTVLSRSIEAAPVPEPPPDPEFEAPSGDGLDFVVAGVEGGSTAAFVAGGGGLASSASDAVAAAGGGGGDPPPRLSIPPPPAPTAPPRRPTSPSSAATATASFFVLDLSASIALCFRWSD